MPLVSESHAVHSGNVMPLLAESACRRSGICIDKQRIKYFSVEGLDENDTVLVYTQKFVQDYFYETQDIHGIFTLSKGNTEAKKAKDKANAEIKKLTEEKKHIEEKAARDEQKHKDEIEKYKNQTWKIKTEYSGGDRVLEFCLEGFKGNRDTLFNQLLSMEKPDGSIDYSIEDLKNEAQQIQREAQSRSFFL